MSGVVVVHACPRGLVTDFGEDIVLRADDGDLVTIPRYGVWKPVPGLGKAEVTLTTDDLAAALAAAEE